MPRDEIEEALYKLYPHLRGTHKMHDVLVARYEQAISGGDKEEVVAREAWDECEERKIRILAEKSGDSEEALGARIVVRSWDGESIREIARSLKVRQRAVLAYLLGFNVWGVLGLKENGERGRKSKSGQIKEIVPASKKRSPFPLTSVRLVILPFCTVEADDPGR